MKVLIVKQNEKVIRDIYPKVKFVESTINTCTFTVSTSRFTQIYDKVKELGYNPYSLMNW